MKVVRQNSNSLLIWKCWNGPIFLGVTFLATGIFGLITPSSIKFTCHRIKSSSCSVTSSGLLGSQVEKIPLNILQGASVKKETDSDGTSYRIMIETDRENFSLLYSNSDKKNRQEIAARIDKFIKDSTQLSLVEEDNNFVSYSMAFFTIPVGILSLQEIFIICTFDKNLNSLTINRYGLFGKKVFTCWLHEIKDILVSRNDDFYQVSIVLMSGTHEPLSHIADCNERNKQKVASILKEFLDIDRAIG